MLRCLGIRRWGKNLFFLFLPFYRQLEIMFFLLFRLYCLYAINYLKFIMLLYFSPATVKMLSNLKTKRQGGFHLNNQSDKQSVYLLHYTWKMFKELECELYGRRYRR